MWGRPFAWTEIAPLLQRLVSVLRQVWPLPLEIYNGLPGRAVMRAAQVLDKLLRKCFKSVG